MPRGPRLDAPGTLHHVIVRGVERRRIVDDDQDWERFLERLGDLASETRTAVCAWALMNNHAHLLVKSGPAGLAGFMRRFLTGHAVYYNRRHGRHGHLCHHLRHLSDSAKNKLVQLVNNVPFLSSCRPIDGSTNV